MTTIYGFQGPENVEVMNKTSFITWILCNKKSLLSNVYFFLMPDICKKITVTHAKKRNPAQELQFLKIFSWYLKLI